MSLGHYRHTPSPLSTVNFDDIKPIQIQHHFNEIHAALKLGVATLAESSITSLRRAADDYKLATTPIPGDK